MYNYVLEVMKLGAVATYVLDEDGVELLETAQTPAGVLEHVEPVLMSPIKLRLHSHSSAL